MTDLNDSINNTTYCDNFIDLTLNNTKGTTACSRFLDVMSDPNNHFLIKHENAGKSEKNYIYTFNGIKVLNNSYYGNHIEILRLNEGSHEPAEERMFQNILTDIDEGGTMIELGSYWCFYSMWFNKTIPNAKNYCIEPGVQENRIGQQNCALNDVKCDFTQKYIGDSGTEIFRCPKLDLNDFIEEKNIEQIDLLHSDIQGAEFTMLQSITNLLDQKKIKYLFISTHSDEIHNNCIKLITDHDYRIITEVDFSSKTFCFDGIIVACHKDNLKFPSLSLGDRQHTKIIDKNSDIGKRIQNLHWVKDHLHWNT